MKTALITGGAGFIGSHLCERFLREGFVVVAVDNFLTSYPENIANLFGQERFHFLEYDVTNFIHVRRKVDIVLHFACPASPVDYLRYPIQTIKAASLGTLNTLELAKTNNARYVLASTSEVYGDPEVHPQPESYWGNVNPIGPRSVYDEAKRFAEALTMAYFREHKVDTRIARIFNTYGPRMRSDDGRVIPNFICQALRGQNLTVYGDGSQTRSFCYIDDMIEGIFRLATQEELEGEIFNLGNPEEYEMRELARIVIELVGSSSGIVYRDLPQDDPKRRKPDISKATRLLKWKPLIDLQNGLTKTVEYFKKKIDTSNLR